MIEFNDFLTIYYALSIYIFALKMPRLALSQRQVVEIIAESRKENPPTLGELAERFNVNKRTIKRRLERYEEDGSLGMKKMIRTPKFSLAQALQARNLMIEHPFFTYDEIKNKLDFAISRSSLRRIAKKFKLSKGVSPQKFLIKDVDRDERIRVAISRSIWNLDDWKNIVFTDESGIDNSGRYRRLCFRPPNARFEQKYIFKSPNKSLRVNYFSWVTCQGTGDLIFYRKMNSKKYCDCLAHMIPILRDTFGHDDFKILHDNARFATSSETQRFLRANNYQRYFISHPTYSPDMNIIENLWGILKQVVRKHTFQYGQVRKRKMFERLLQDKWSEIPFRTIVNTYNSLPSRMRKVVDADGHLIKY